MQTYFMNLSAQAQATFLSTSTLSAVSSLLIISIILRSPSKLSSVYHKIMFSLSCWDTLSSVAMALTTLPMSKDVLGLYVYDTVPDDALVPYFNAVSLAYLDPNFEVYNFSGLVLGNAGTCAAQGFVINIGQAFAIYSNVTLSLYYVCTIRFKMTEETARKKLLPIMVGISLLLGIPGCIYPLIVGLYNPQPFEPYCTWGPYPYGCNLKGLVEVGFELPDCIRGNVAPQHADVFGLIIASFLGLCFIVMAVSLVLVVMSVFQTEMAARRVVKDQGSNERDHTHETNNETVIEADVPSNTGTHQKDVDNNFEETRTVLRLALMYIAAFFITWIWTVLGNFISIEDPDISFVNTIHFARRIFLSSQGFFNALIFIYNKICFARQVIPDLSFSDALKMVIFSPSTMSEALVSSLDIVEEDMNEREQEARIQELIEADLERDQQQQQISIPPASIPSNFESVETPSFALSNAMSSQGIDKELEDRIKNKGAQTRKFYTSTPKKYLHFTGDTLAAAKSREYYSDKSSPHHVSSNSLSLLRNDNDGGDVENIHEEGVARRESPQEAILSGEDIGPTSSDSNSLSLFRNDNNGGNVENIHEEGVERRESPQEAILSGEDIGITSSIYTTNSMLSGFSSVLEVSTKNHISVEGGNDIDKDADKDADADDENLEEDIGSKSLSTSC